MIATEANAENEGVPPSDTSICNVNMSVSSLSIGLVVTINPVIAIISKFPALFPLKISYSSLPLLPASLSVAATWNTLVPDGSFSKTVASKADCVNRGKNSFTSSTKTAS